MKQLGKSQADWGQSLHSLSLPVAGCCEDVGYTALADLAHSTVCVCVCVYAKSLQSCLTR